MEYQLRKKDTGFYAVKVDTVKNITTNVVGATFEDQQKNFDQLLPQIPIPLQTFALNYNRFIAKPSQVTTLQPPNTVTLMQHQHVACDFLCKHARCILSLECGLGKTVILIAFIYHLHKSLTRGIRALVIVPAGLIENWTKELKTIVPDLTIDIIKTAKTANFDTNANFFIISDSLIGKLKTQLASAAKFDIIGVDEAHSVKHFSSQKSKALYKFKANTSRMVLLTGTPALEYLHLYGLIRMLHPVFKNFFHYQKHGVSAKTQEEKMFFAERYLIWSKIPIGRGKETFQFKGKKRADELKAVLSVFKIRMKKANVLDLPPLIKESVVVGSLNTRQIKEYQKNLQDIQLLREKNATSANAKMSELVRQTMRIKTPFVVTYIKNLLDTQPKFCCFVHHHYLSDAIQVMLTEQKIGFININSDVKKMSTRAQLLDNFEKDANMRVAILSLGCAGTGLTLTCINLCIFCERVFDAVKTVQSESRLHRIGQVAPVTLIYLDLEHSTDTMLIQNVKRKCATEAHLLDDNDLKPQVNHPTNTQTNLQTNKRKYTQETITTTESNDNKK